jgi:hypothetical protein
MKMELRGLSRSQEMPRCALTLAEELLIALVYPWTPNVFPLARFDCPRTKIGRVMPDPAQSLWLRCRVNAVFFSSPRSPNLASHCRQGARCRARVFRLILLPKLETRLGTTWLRSGKPETIFSCPSSLQQSLCATHKFRKYPLAAMFPDSAPSLHY